jgi:Cupin
MSNVQRRDVLIGSALAAAAMAAVKPALAGDPSFMNNVPDPLLAGDDLPTFKFALEKSEGKVIGGSSGKEATVKQLPISKGIAGVSMRLEPGAMRELHWHATAAEWAFVIEGRVRTTVIDPQGRAETRGNYEAINLSQWIAGNPADVLAVNFAQAAGFIREIPQARGFSRERQRSGQVSAIRWAVMGGQVPV